jgi:hypothetical protein
MTEARCGLARAQLQLGSSAAALATATTRQEPAYPAGEPAIRLLEAVALLQLDHADQAAPAFTSALAAADALLALADSNVAALQARVLALAGLAAATRVPAQASEAVEAVTRARTIITAAGVAADTQRLLAMITAHDQGGVLAELSTAQDL